MITPEYIVGILQTHSWEGQEIVKLIRKYGEQEVANFISSKQDVIKSVCPVCKCIAGSTCAHSWHYDNGNWKVGQTVL
jgi:hypothetical protein